MSPCRRPAHAKISNPLLQPQRWLIVLAALLLGACASAPRRHAAAGHHSATPRPARASATTQEANNVLIHAIGLVGTPYHWGGNTPDSGFDCSGLVDYVFRTSAHVDLPRTSHAMSRMDRPKIRNPARLLTGDLLFFRTEGRRISHVAIYVGNGRFVHAPNTGGTVRLDNLHNRYWHRHFAYARRVL